MDPLAGMRTDSTGYISGDDEVEHSDGKSAKGIVIPELNIDSVTMTLHGGEEVVPYFTPRGSYQTPRTELGADKLLEHLTKEKHACNFSGHTFTESSAKAFCTYLTGGGCSLKTLKFVNCGLSTDVFGLICAGLALNKSVTTLHFEGCSCRPEFCAALKGILMSPESALCTLNFVNVTLPVESFQHVVDGVIYQNNLPNGLNSLSLEGCRLNNIHAEQLERLIAGSKKLRSLILQGNQLGASVLRPKMSTPRNLLLSTGQPSKEDTPASKGIIAIANGLAANDSLINLVLASNRVCTADFLELARVLAKNNKKVLVNLTGNSLENQMARERLITKGSSPRSIASPIEQIVTPRSRASSRTIKRQVGNEGKKITVIFKERTPGE